MKKIFSIVLALFAMAGLSVSCQSEGAAANYQQQLVSIVDGNHTSGNFYVLLDNGARFFVKNANKFTIPISAYVDGEARALIYYSVEGEQKTGYDAVINIHTLFPIATNVMTNQLEADNVAEDMGQVSISYGYFARKYLTLLVNYRYSNADQNSKHILKLVYNTDPEHKGQYQSYYKDNDGYIYLELYHDTNGDAEVIEYENYECFMIDLNKYDIDLHNAEGIKIIYRDMLSGIKTFTIPSTYIN